MNSLPANDKDFINRLKEIILENLSDENFGPAELAAQCGISRSGLHRKMKRLSGISVSHFIREFRLEKAKDLLLSGRMTVSEVSYAVGFGSPTYFNKCFHDQYGFPPGEVRHQPEPVSETVTVLEGGDREIHKRKSLFNNVTLFAGWMVLLVLLGWTLHTLLAKPSVEKSIAVLPFINDSPGAVDDGFNNQVAEAIRDKLDKIGNLKVTSRTSVERYRNDKNRSTRQIARELDVNYIIEGSGYKIGDQVRITVQLIDGRSDRYLISRQYDRKYEDIFILYTEIALEVVNEIKVIITPEEEDRIKKSATISQAAMKLVVWGDEMRNRNAKSKQRLEFLSQADAFYRRAIRLDSLYTDAYYGLAETSFARWETDSALQFVNKVLQIDPENASAYFLKGAIYHRWRIWDEMEKCLLMCLKYTPDNIDANHRLGGLYYARGEFCRGFEYLFKSLKIMGELNPEYSVVQLGYRELTKLHIFRSLYALGFYEEGTRYGEQWLELTNDDLLGFNYNVLWGGIINCRFEETYQLGLQTPENILCLHYMAMNLIFMRKYDEALVYFIKAKERIRSRGNDAGLLDYLIGFAYLNTGKQEEAEKYFKSSSDFLNARMKEHPEYKNPDPHYSIMDAYWGRTDFVLASMRAVKGDKEKALAHLRALRNNYPASDVQVVTFLKHFPMFDNIRREPEFQDYMKAAEKHFLSERKKVEKLLRD